MTDRPVEASRVPVLGRRVFRRGQPLLAAAAALALLIGARAAWPDPFTTLQTYVFDTTQRIAPRQDADRVAPGTGVVVVDIDDESLARVGQWPWPRSIVADLIRRLQDAGASAIGLDIVFAEPDRTSPSTIAAAWAQRDRLVVTSADGRSALPDYDRDLAAAMVRGRVVTGYSLVPAQNERLPGLSNSVAAVGVDAGSVIPNYLGAVPNLAQFDQAAAGQGTFTVGGSTRNIAAPLDDPAGADGRDAAETDHDEVTRALPLFIRLNGTIVPSLAAEVLRVASGDDDAGTALRAERVGGPETPVTGYTARIGRWTVPLATDGTILLHYANWKDASARLISAARVLDPDAVRELRRIVSGRIVLVGTSAIGLADLRPTPLSRFTPGVMIHAAAIEQIQAGDVLTRPGWASAVELAAAILFGLVVGTAVSFGGIRIGAACLLAGSGSAIGGAWFAFVHHDCLLDPSFVTLAGPAAFVAALAARHFASEQRANAMRSAFARYLSPQLVEVLARHPDRLRLGGEEREMTFLFTDLEGFTAFTEAVAPAQLVATLNRYLDGVCAIAMDHGGTIDKIVGDAVHVMFNAPLDQPDHATRAVRCALAIDTFAEAFAADAEQLAAVGRAFGTTRIGINTGRAVVGNFGGNRRFDYTAHGDAINTAARLEAANKRLGTRLCISRATVDAITGASGFRFRPIGALELKGKANIVDVFAPMRPDAPESAWADRYGDAFARLSRGEEDGADAILALLRLHPTDPLLRFHAARIERGQRGTALPLQAA